MAVLSLRFVQAVAVCMSLCICIAVYGPSVREALDLEFAHLQNKAFRLVEQYDDQRYICL